MMGGCAAVFPRPSERARIHSPDWKTDSGCFLADTLALLLPVSLDRCESSYSKISNFSCFLRKVTGFPTLQGWRIVGLACGSFARGSEKPCRFELIPFSPKGRSEGTTIRHIPVRNTGERSERRSELLGQDEDSSGCSCRPFSFPWARGFPT
ncbi:hypothetical protein ASPWEDRAFT_546700 [Aspergillus wentii DTO 134E9]|uniref:Uncharacterized protein n=1 Tax=Aspergillus wentii DTO 134E9 TaxID=1073089 RepID=A0A1L9RG73_ASPWE|nr:uncharacterized protein ASPWEDRAFT_546700 [Aspergillus wentii DTO 134E9]OJJ33853.1 hypothetical protein ASPWEDRAFT_546700 [Aspergillus wentii DTO 134E9]